MQKILSITEISEYIRCRMEEDALLNQIAVRGEISNYKKYPSGHHYFTLKDDNASLKCVMFKGNAARLRFVPENGMKVIALGKVTAYPRDGAYQLYCNAMQVDGIGDLHAAFEQLKKKLAAEGLFNPELKKPLPRFPNRIGIITSSAGAAVHDMLRIIHTRYPLTKVLLLPVRVQGVEAPDEIAAAIRYANHYKLADVLIVGRGGGSIEDLWAFNDERVAYAIYKSDIPIISAVGHEPDVTISDYVADVRAATPSNAAEIVVPDQNALRQNMDSAASSMAIALNRQIKLSRQRLNTMALSRVLSSPTGYINQRRQTLDSCKTRLLSAQNSSLQKKRVRFSSYAAKLDAMSPLKTLSRGYSIVQLSNGGVVSSIQQVKAKDQLSIRVSDGIFNVTVSKEMEDQL